MYGETRNAHSVRAMAVVAAATLLALAVPVGAPLYADVYPSSNELNYDDAVDKANLQYGFEPPQVVQYETATFTATIIYGTAIDVDQPTVNVAFSNEAVLTAVEEGTFDIVPTSPSRRDLDEGTRREGGGYEMSWTWDVTPLLAGERQLTLQILPTVLIEGEVQENVANINEPIPVTVDVHPVQQEFDAVLVAAESMQTEIPEDMVVGEQYDVSASLSLAGETDLVTVDIQLAKAEGSADVTILEKPAAAAVVAYTGQASAVDQVVVRHWTVIPDEPGQVAFVFTATVEGVAGAKPLQGSVPNIQAVRATAPAPSFWDRIQQPVLYVTPFVVLAGGILALWAAWKRRSARKGSDDDSAESWADPSP
jgi:hypothetical protein